MKTLLTRLVLGVCSILTLGNHCQAAVVSFGSDTNQFNMEFVTIGNPFNTADTTGAPNPAGSVGYSFGMGKYEVSRAVITKYNANFGAANGLEITLNSMDYLGTIGVNKPATGVSWNECARFVNWLNTSTGGFAAYRFETSGVNDMISLWDPLINPLDYDPTNRFRSKRAKYVLPSYDEWYKAAYFDPSTLSYWDFPSGSDTAPVSVASGTSPGTAVYARGLFEGPADVDQAGGLSPYGVMGLGGNVYEWEESTFETVPQFFNLGGHLGRGLRSTFYHGTDSSRLSSTFRGIESPVSEHNIIGFRVAMVTPSGGEVPEPSTMAIFGLGTLGMAYRARRKAKT